jgi:hypothetical protein
MKKSVPYLERYRFAILNLEYGMIEWKSKIKKSLKLRFQQSFQKTNKCQRVLE